ncbi:hypothetical protein Tco_0446812 [Tanacetum coccineum]
MNLSFHLHVMRGVDSEPSGYYYHVLQDKKERMRLAEPPSGSTYVVTMPYHVSYKLQNLQAIRIIMGIAGRTTDGRENDDPFQGFARYLQIVASIEQFSDLSEMTLEEAIGRLKTYEERIKHKSKQVDKSDMTIVSHDIKNKRTARSQIRNGKEIPSTFDLTNIQTTRSLAVKALDGGITKSNETTLENKERYTLQEPQI